MPYSFTTAAYDNPAYSRLGCLHANAMPEQPRRVVPYDCAPIIRRSEGAELLVEVAQWGMVPPGYLTQRPQPRSGWLMNTAVARSEIIWKQLPFSKAWAQGQRCLIPATSFHEPSHDNGRQIWWEMRRSDHQPWGLAGLWLDWTDPVTSASRSTFVMPTICVDHHPLLRRLLKPDPELPTHTQHVRAVVPLEPDHWEEWLRGTPSQAWGLLNALPPETFDAFPIHENAVSRRQRLTR